MEPVHPIREVEQRFWKYLDLYEQVRLLRLSGAAKPKPQPQRVFVQTTGGFGSTTSTSNFFGPSFFRFP